MRTEHREEHQQLIEKTVNYLQDKGYESIKADIEGFETPKSFLMRSNGTEITPDIVVESNGRIQYIEVGYKAEDTDLLKTKWKFIKTLAELKNRHFKVISHKGSYGFTDQLMRDIKLTSSSIRI